MSRVNFLPQSVMEDFEPIAKPVGTVIALADCAVEAAPSPARQQQADLERTVLLSLSGRVTPTVKGRGAGFVKRFSVTIAISLAVWGVAAGILVAIGA